MYELITGDWELVDADGNRLAVASLAQISINSINQTLRPRQSDPAPTGLTPGGGGQALSGEARYSAVAVIITCPPAEAVNCHSVTEMRPS